jgi:hypothetical protein
LVFLQHHFGKELKKKGAAAEEEALAERTESR